MSIVFHRAREAAKARDAARAAAEAAKAAPGSAPLEETGAPAATGAHRAARRPNGRRP